MSTTIHNHLSLGKLGALLFARQTQFPAAPQHKGLLASLAAWRKRRAAVAELSAMSDRDLADIGLTRQEIPGVLRRK